MSDSNRDHAAMRALTLTNTAARDGTVPAEIYARRMDAWDKLTRGNRNRLSPALRTDDSPLAGWQDRAVYERAMHLWTRYKRVSVAAYEAAVHSAHVANGEAGAYLWCDACRAHAGYSRLPRW